MRERDMVKRGKQKPPWRINGVAGAALPQNMKAGKMAAAE